MFFYVFLQIIFSYLASHLPPKIPEKRSITFRLYDLVTVFILHMFVRQTIRKSTQHQKQLSNSIDEEMTHDEKKNVETQGKKESFDEEIKKKM